MLGNKILLKEPLVIIQVAGHPLHRVIPEKVCVPSRLRGLV